MHKCIIDRDKIKKDNLKYFNRCLGKITCKANVPFSETKKVMDYIESNDIQHINYNLIQKILKILNIRKKNISYFTIVCLIKFENITEDDLLSLEDKKRIRQRFEDTWTGEFNSIFSLIYKICRELEISKNKMDILVRIIHVPSLFFENVNSDMDVVNKSSEL